MLLVAIFVACANGHPGNLPEFGHLMHEGGEPFPNLEGVWIDGDSNGHNYVLRRIQPSGEIAVPPNSTYALECGGGAVCGQCRQHADYDYQTSQRTAMRVVCHGADLVAGLEHVPRGHGILKNSGSQIFWGERAWDLKGPAPVKGGAVSNIHTVHMVFMNHYDVGYTDYINPVDGMYMHTYFPKAAATAEDMRKANSSDSFVYTTHPWLVQRFLECPCPSALPPPHPEIANLEGVWTGDSFKERFYISRIGDREYAARCLTMDWSSDSPVACPWETGNCTQSHDGKSVSCVFSTSTQVAEIQQNGSLMYFDSSVKWHKFVGILSGLWYGPSDPADFLIMAHDAKSGEVDVWWDTEVTPAFWKRGSGMMKGSNVSLLIPDYRDKPISGIVDSDWDQITWLNGSALTWNKHSHQCLLQEPACQEHACLARSLGNNITLPLQCPTDKEKAVFSAAARRQDIVWHAGPFNTQPENMSPHLFDAGVALARRLDKLYYGKAGKITQSLNIRDAIYSTRSVVPLLHKNNITGLTIGSNGANSPPQVPKLHRWVDPATDTDVIVAYHPYGYGGYGAGDCAESPNGVALCTEFRSDNTGPPANVKEVMDSLNSVRGLYPGAKVKTSTFDAFFADVMPAKDKLPVVDLELGDTWVYGNPSDPLKMAMNRAVQRVWIDCLRAGDASCSMSSPAIQNMTWWLLKTPEHTWGAAGIAGWGGGDQYDTQKFRSHLKQPEFMRAAATWAEQSIYNEIAIRALEESGHPLAARARAEANMLENVQKPDMEKLGYRKAADVMANVVLKSAEQSVQLAFGPDGAITSFESGGVAWATTTDTLAGFVYQTFGEDDWKAFTYAYCNDHSEQAGFSKPGSGNFSVSKLWRPSLSEVWVRSTDSVVAMMTFSGPATTLYGAPQIVYVNLTIAPLLEGNSWALDVSLITLGKQPTMIGEAQLLTFKPAPPLRAPVVSPSRWRKAADALTCPSSGCLAPSSEHGCKTACPLAASQCCWESVEEATEQCGTWDECIGFWGPDSGYFYARGVGSAISGGWAGAQHWMKERSWSSAWRLDKLGGAVDPEGVQDGGTQYTHGVWDGASVETASGNRLKIRSLDASNMNPITASFPVGNPLPATYNRTEALAGKGLSRMEPGSVVGMSVNLHNNLWNTNYPLYYPYFDKRYCSEPLECKNANLLFRFQISASHGAATATFI